MKLILLTIVYVLFPLVIALVTYSVSNKNESLWKSVISFYNKGLLSGNSTIALICMILGLFVSQLISGYAFNRITRDPEVPLTVVKERSKIFKWLNIAINYFAERLFLLTYALYEFVAYYFFVILVLGHVLALFKYDWTRNILATFKIDWKFSINLLIAIMLTLVITFVVGGLIKKTLDSRVLNEYTFIGKCIFEKKVAKIIYDIQNQLCNIAYILILPLTFLSIFGGEVDKGETVLFFALTSLVVASYCFQIGKSKLYDFFFFKSLDYTKKSDE